MWASLALSKMMQWNNTNIITLNAYERKGRRGNQAFAIDIDVKSAASAQSHTQVDVECKCRPHNEHQRQWWCDSFIKTWSVCYRSYTIMCCFFLATLYFCLKTQLQCASFVEVFSSFFFFFSCVVCGSCGNTMLLRYPITLQHNTNPTQFNKIHYSTVETVQYNATEYKIPSFCNAFPQS